MLEGSGTLALQVLRLKISTFFSEIIKMKKHSKILLGLATLAMLSYGLKITTDVDSSNNKQVSHKIKTSKNSSKQPNGNISAPNLYESNQVSGFVGVTADNSFSVDQFLELYPIAASLAGTDLDGEISFDDQGKLRQDFSLRLLYDQLLSVRGEWTESQISDWLTEYSLALSADGKIPNDGVAAILESFQAYTDYLKTAAETLPAFSFGNKEDVASIETYAQELSTLRRELLGDDAANNFFASEERYDQAQLARVKIQLNDELSETDKEAEIERWQEEQSTVEHEHRVNVLRHEQYREDVQQLAGQDSSALDIDAIRQQYFGDEAANRLAELDAQRAQWSQKQEDYHSAMEELAKNFSDSSDDYVAAQKDYVLERFSEAEQRRLGVVFD